MLYRRRGWVEELAIIDRVMRAVSTISDPNELVRVYWDGVHELLPIEDYLALSRRGVEPPDYIVTRSSRFKEHFNPWTEREKLPRLRGGLLGEIAYADAPLVIDDIPARLAADDPGRFYLEGFQSLIALPNYDEGKGLNVGISLFGSGVQFDRSVVPLMHWQAGLFGRGTQNQVLRNQLAAALAELDRELQVVGAIQRSLLPPELPNIPGFQFAAHYQTSARAGGDYYDFFPLGDDEWGLFIADVSGHGTPAAVLMAITHAIAHTRPGTPKPPSELLAHLNRHLTQLYTSSGAFVTAFYGTLSPARRQLSYAVAGHNPPRLLRGERVLAVDGVAGLPLGISAGERYDEATLTLETGDVLLLYTDGITEAMSPPDAVGRRALFGVERLDEVLRLCARCPASEHLERIRGAVASFAGGAAASDDQTLVTVRCTG
ncbi:MAG: hypothetical protein CHACPFDD_03642 [Phycisphaerae bacterium]|nr:hypothetical protein [Phycisphaerae bacterium]